MGKTLRSFVGVIIGIAMTATHVYASSHEPFYKGKVVKLVVGFSPGGGFDTYSRTLARHMPKHIPGNPTIIVDNMTGAGSLIAANHLYKVAKPDGLTVGNFAGGLILNQVLEKPGIEFDARKFEYIGVIAKNDPVCAFTKKSGITTINKWMSSSAAAKLGGLSPGNETDDNPKILKAALGLPLRVVSGYKGTSDIRLAAEGGELDGACWGWNSMRPTWQKSIEAGDVFVVLQATPKHLPDLPPNIPLAIDFAKTEEERQLIQMGIHNQSDLLRLYGVPPATPQDRVNVLRKAFEETMKDPEFLAEAKKAKLGVDPVSGNEVQRIVGGLFQLSPGLVAKLRDLLSK